MKNHSSYVAKRGCHCAQCIAEKAAYTRARNEKGRAYLDAVKAVPCADCGGSFPPECMDFDHLGDKKFQIGASVSRSLEALMAEIAKCEIVCANCHRIRTKARGR